MEKKSFLGFSFYVSLVASLGGFLFGYHSGVVAGALVFVTKEFHLSSWQGGSWVSLLIIGALIGALSGGCLADRLGRKKTLFLSAFFFVVGSFVQMEAATFFHLMLGRGIAGIGVGIVSVVSPLYIAEMSRKDERGVMVAINQLMISAGILSAYIAGYLLATAAGWREMMGYGIVFSLFFFFLLCFIPETPSFLAALGRKHEAKIIVQKIEEKEEEIFSETLRKSPEETFWKHLCEPNIRSALFVGIMISLFQQITGINLIVYYAPRIFEMVGFGADTFTFLGAVGIGLVNFLATILSLALIARCGRRVLLLVGVGGMAVSLFFISLGLLATSELLLQLTFFSLFSFVAFFAISLGPIVWIVLAEIFPIGIRGRAMGMALVVNWLSNYCVSLSFLPLIELLGKGGTFLIYVCISFAAFWLIFWKVPETKGKSFEEIQKFWRKKK